ncbi:nucleotidyl transferase AbiEii/AbiGii toxin family protein [Paractinoplanes maris]|uniref:nucleotidyl transferase AbiEii/AbiGii toxin family protein n=1 Tax=Paractinoplanes maris TaxID=1734446 RepID=UPI0020220432|nr:nucleotidyl transferase AbiEii/AbiGii toxin family protein [Actinoplanes maris]
MTDKLRIEAANSPWPLADMQRQYAYDQLVERLYRTDDGWVIKGATALLARRLSVRHTVDIDIYRAGAIGDVERLLRKAAQLDIGDWMRFEVGTTVRIQAAGAQASRVKIQARAGTRVWSGFQVDIVADGIQMSGEPEPVSPLTSASAIDREKLPWRAYPLVDHVADKVCAILERHGGRPSTRYKDLIDLVAIVERVEIVAEPQLSALHGEAQRRGLKLPEVFDAPDHHLWTLGYRAEARRTVGLAALELVDALTVVGPFLNPLLNGTAVSVWRPAPRSWTSALP